MVGMTVTQDPRFGVDRWSANSDPWPGRAGWMTLVGLLISQAARGSHGAFADRPAAKEDSIYFATDSKRIYYAATLPVGGLQWTEISPVGTGLTPSILGVLVDGATGSSRAAAREDHAHPEPDWVDLDLATGWAGYNSTPQFRRIGRMVQLRGSAKFVTAGGIPSLVALGSHAGLAPLGYSNRWPYIPVALNTDVSGGTDITMFGQLSVRVDNTIRIHKVGAGAPNTVHLDGVTWPVA